MGMFFFLANMSFFEILIFRRNSEIDTTFRETKSYSEWGGYNRLIDGENKDLPSKDDGGYCEPPDEGSEGIDHLHEADLLPRKRTG